MCLCANVCACMWSSEDGLSIIASCRVFETWSFSDLVVTEYIGLVRECWDLLIFPSLAQGLQNRPVCLAFKNVSSKDALLHVLTSMMAYPAIGSDPRTQLAVD